MFQNKTADCFYTKQRLLKITAIRTISYTKIVYLPINLETVSCTN